jgi:hypothetical protein
VTPPDGPDLHRDKLGLTDAADRRALRDLRIIAPVILIVAAAAWVTGAGPFMLLPAVAAIFAFVQWRAALIRRKARREYRSRAGDSSS